MSALQRFIGTIETPWGGATILVVRGPEGELLIPLADAFVKKVDVAGGRLVAERPQFLPHREGAHAH